jgi:tetratricopeptide (TPR) repeat protein
MFQPLEIAAAFLDAGRLDDTETICHDVLRTRSDPWALCLLAGAANARKAYPKALDLVQRAVAGGSNAAELHFERAVAHSGLGATAAAVEAARKAVAINPNVSQGYALLSRLLLPGEDYMQILPRLHDLLKPRSYVEIGVHTGASLVLAKPPTVAVGIDPKPMLAAVPHTVCKIMPLTSDAYFASRDLRTDVEAASVDFAFIDGQHLFEQALRDFMNIERFAGPRTVVAIHDCLPVDALTAARNPTTDFSSGDVWKLMVCLRELRADLDAFTVAAAPTGLGLVVGLDSGSTILSKNFDQIVARFVAMEPDASMAQVRQQVGAIPNDWNTIKGRLQARLDPRP